MERSEKMQREPSKSQLIKTTVNRKTHSGGDRSEVMVWSADIER